MDSRMTKYYNEEELSNTRCYRNQELYKEISKNEIDNYDIKSNATVIGDNKKEIDVEKIKKILDTRYNDTPKRQSIRLEETKEEVIEREPTKEYDINVIIEKAKEGKQESYEEERLKTIHNTQYDILKKLDGIKKEDEVEEDVDEKLKSLINTITINENKNNNSDPLDILSDLKGNDNTETLDGLKDELTDVDTEIEKIVKEEEKKDNTSNFDTKMINSFYTSSNALKSNDFEELDEGFKEEIESNSIIVKILIGLVVVVFIVGLYLLIKTLYFK